MTGEKAVAINRAWELWPNIDPKAVAQMVSGGWEARAAQAVSLPDRDKAAFEAAVGTERQRQIEKGYTPAHDDEKGAKHLINWACDYIVKGEPVKAVALLVATLQHLDRLPLSTQPAAGEVDGKRKALINSIDNWTPALVRKYEQTAFDYMVELVDELRAEPQPEPQPTELANLFPGTLAALDNLNIRPEAQ